MSVSEENEQLSQQLDPRSSLGTQGAALLARTLSKVRNYDSRRATAGFIRTVSKGMYYRTGEEVNDGFGNLLASCRE